jgi:hypothetical protein
MSDNQTNAEEMSASTTPVGNNIPEESSSEQPGQSGAGDDESVGKGAESRIRKLSADKRRALQEAEYWKAVAQKQAQQDAQFANQRMPQHPSSQPVPSQDQYSNDEVDRAFRTLKDRGMVTKEELESYLLRVEWDRQHDRNESEVARMGKDMPAYDRQEVEEHARRKGISDPMAAYRDLYWDEILDQRNRSSSPSSKKIPTSKPSKPSGDTGKQPLDLEEFRRKLTGPKGREFYEELRKNPEQFDEVLKSMQG